MEFMLDTADAQAVKELSSVISVAGVTTNPTIITKSGKAPEQVAREMLEVLSEDQAFFMQSIATDFEGIMADARKICSLRPKNMYVKIPVTRAGLRAIKAAKAEGLGVLATAIYSADEAFLAAMNGADYLAPYVNRMCNYGDGIQQVSDLLDMLVVNGLESKVVAASFKNSGQVHDIMHLGAHAVTVSPDIVWSMIDHPGTTIAVDEFSAAWKASFGRSTFSAE